jgi:hypothetical protein
MVSGGVQGSGSGRGRTGRNCGTGSWRDLLRAKSSGLSAPSKGTARPQISDTRAKHAAGCVTYLVVAPAQHDVIQTTLGLVHPVFARVKRVLRVGVGTERVWVDVLVGELAADDKRVTLAELIRIVYYGDK